VVTCANGSEALQAYEQAEPSLLILDVRMPLVDGLTVCRRLEADGVGGFLATVITDHLDQMCWRLENLVRLRERSELARRIIHGLHIEGPFLSPENGYRGAHTRDAIMHAGARCTPRLSRTRARHMTRSGSPNRCWKWQATLLFLAVCLPSFRGCSLAALLSFSCWAMTGVHASANAPATTNSMSFITAPGG
jgi:hypothetical protein